MPKPYGTTLVRNSRYDLLLAADTPLLSQNPLMRVLDLENKSGGTIELVMNRVVAERPMAAVVEFLQAGTADDTPTFAAERSQKDHAPLAGAPADRLAD